MIVARDIAFGLFAAWRLAHFDRAGMQYVDNSVEGFWKSFFAGAIAFPGYAALRALMLVSNPETMPTASWPRTIAAYLIGYVVALFAFPVIMTVIVEILDRRERFVPLVVAFNWSTVVQIAVLLPAGILVTSGSGGGLSFLVYFAVMSGIVVYLWFIVRTALDVPGVTAGALVALNFVVNLLINGVTDLMVRV